MNNKFQVFALHFAGGGFYSYNFLKNYISFDIEFISLELPGRGKRVKEDLIKDKALAIEDYFDQIKTLRNKNPYIIYGHSMGATMGLSLVQRMEDIQDPPVGLVVSGNPGPGITKTNKDGTRKVRAKRYLMSDDGFKDELRELGGVPEEILENNELFQFFNPIMRADFEILEKDNFSEKEIVLNVPIYAVMGSEEEYHHSIENWKRFTCSSFQSKILPGDHFFIKKYPKELIDVMMHYFKHSVTY